MDVEKIEVIVGRANEGDKVALEKVVYSIKDYVYNLSLKMLLHPEDAQDATQEILIKVITHLSTFSFKSKFTTWVYRLASNYLLTQKGKKSRNFISSFSEYEVLIDTGQSDLVLTARNEGELRLLEEEVKVSCTQGLLLCLNPEDRLVYILSEILEFNSMEGGEILEISSENFRKKLSRSRVKIRNFLTRKCGLVDSSNACRCSKKVDFLVNSQIIDPKKYKFAGLRERSLDLMKKIDEVDKSVAIYRSVPSSSAPETVVESIRAILSNV